MSGEVGLYEKIQRGNLIDNMIICAEMKFRHLIFAGAVGGLSTDFEIGDFCTPEVNISAVYANKYHYTRSVIIPQIIFTLAGEK